MRIGLLAPPWIPTPPPAYGGIERVVHTLGRGLIESGHEVTLVAAPGSRLDGARVVTPLATLPSTIGLPDAEWDHVLAAPDALEDCDVIFDHSGPLGALMTALEGPAAAHVVHGPLSGGHPGRYARLRRMAPRLRLIAISHAQRTLARQLPFVGVCHNGIDLSDVPFEARAGEYLAFVGRISPDKGVAQAIEIAHRAGRRLVVAAKCRERAEREHFDRVVAPHVGRGVEWLGELDPVATVAMMRGARALLFPIQWEEPFGMVMIEAMAGGTPVIATPRGSVPEIVVDGRTGFVAAETAALVAAVDRIGEIDRAACRLHVEERFSIARMTRAYERVAFALIGAGASPRRRSRQLTLASGTL